MPSYSKQQKDKLLKIPYVKGAGPHTQKLRDLAKSWNKGYGTVWTTWKNLHTKTSNAVKKAASKVSLVKHKPTKVVAVTAGTGNNITTYVLEQGAEIAPRSEADILKDKLRPILDAMDVYDAAGTRHAIPIESSKTGMVRHFLSTDPDFAKKAWTISAVKDNPKVSRIFRKA